MTRRVLIVAPANSPVPNFSALAFRLELEGYSVEFASNYAQAFNRLVSLVQPRPDLIVLANAPRNGFDGLELARQLKASALLEAIPLFFYSFEDHPNMLNTAYAVGASHYEVALKPPEDNLEDFAQSVKHFIDARTTAFYRLTFASPICN